MMIPMTEDAASFVPPIPVPSSVMPIDLSDIITPSIINDKLFSPQQVACHKEKSSQDQPKYEVADIFNLYGEEYRQNHKLTSDQLNVMYAIEHCRTAEYGFHADVCDNCGHIETAYNSCRNRHCPKCQGIAKRKWVEVRIDELLPVAYHHATFTLPNQISILSLHNQKLIYDLLFNAASQTLLVFGDDPKWLGAKPGFYGILHTWSQTLWPHVHPHFIVPAGGLTDAGKWIEPKYKGKFLFPVKALSKVFRGKFIEGFKKAYYAGELVLPDNLKIKDDDEFEQWINLLVSNNMPRKARIDAPGALHHIIVRGIERRKIFYDDPDRNNFLERLGVVLTETGTPCFEWALIPNHLHLLLRTGVTPIATVMRRLLTGYAVSFNHRHRRHGQLFQNRYKSILCQEDLYLLELVRYIHLNPLRARLVKDLKDLDKYPYCGHNVLMGKRKRDWQDADYILKFYDSKCSTARRRYRKYVEKGIADGRRSDLVGGGLIRSAGGWSAVKELRRDRMKGDERILGEGDFVETVLKAAQENLERKYELEAQGYNFDWLVKRVAQLLEIEPKDVLAAGKYVKTVKARSLLCYWGVRELGMTTVELAKRVNLAQPTVSQAVSRGKKIAEKQGLNLKDQVNQ